MQSLKAAILCCTLLYLGFNTAPLYGQDTSGRSNERWRGEFLLKDSVRSPFNMEVSPEGDVYFVNGDERYRSGRFNRRADSVYVPFDQFSKEFALRVDGPRLVGELRRQEDTSVPIPVTLTPGTHRFNERPKVAGVQRDLSGTYSVEFTNPKMRKWSSVALFKQTGDKLHATFLKVSGDAGYLEGVVWGDSFALSSFIGSSPDFYTGRIKDGKIRGKQFTSTITNTFVGRLDPNATLPDAFQQTRLKPGHQSLNFSFPDIDGNMVSLQDPRFRGKAVIVAITGSWCHNCSDEAAFLSTWYKENKSRGIEVIAIHYELRSDSGFVRKALTRFRDRFGITYTQVFGGTTAGTSVLESLPSLASFKAFPTTFFIDKSGRVEKIHTGYSGPATGKYHDIFVTQFNAEVDRLLGNRR